MPSSILNSDDGVISGTSGLKSSGGDDGVLKIQNNGTDAVTVASDGDVTLAADLSVTGNLLFNSGYGSVATAYGCRAWVNFDGTTNVGGNCTIRASGNVSTVADNGTGDYTVNFTTAMPDTNYAAIASAKRPSGSTEYPGLFTEVFNTGSVRLSNVQPAVAFYDSSIVNVAIFR
jgi:hypothetical protein